MVSLIHENVLKYLDYFQSTDEYVPLVLHNYVGFDYQDRINKDVELEFYRVRTGLQGTGDYNKYLEDDLMRWLKKHKEFKDIIK